MVVGGQRYSVGNTVYYGGFEYIVKSGEKGAFLSHPDGGGYSDSPISGVREMVHEFNYRNPSININSPYTKLGVKILNGEGSETPERLIKSSKDRVSRVLGAPEGSTLRYWECFKFHSGIVATDKVETVTTGDWSSITKLKS